MHQTTTEHAYSGAMKALPEDNDAEMRSVDPLLSITATERIMLC